MNPNKTTDILWVNTGRALSMIGIYVAHCNEYYWALDSNALLFSSLFRIAFFYFISGFLFFRSLEKYTKSEKFLKICNKLIWPALLFPSIIWIPKALAHGSGLDLHAFALDVFGGTATWFVSSIIIGQIALLLLLLVFKRYTLVLISSFILFLSALYLNKLNPTPFPWYYKSGMIGTFFLTLGGGLYKYRNSVPTSWLQSKKLLLISFIACIITHIYTYNSGMYISIRLVNYDNIPLGLFSNLIGIIFMLQLCHYIPNIKWVQYFGKNSIVFYFMAGGIPLIMGLVTRHIFPTGGYLTTLIETAVCIALVFPITYIINRYFSWMLDFSKITNWIKASKG